MDQIRAFIAVNIPTNVLSHIRSIQTALSAGGLSMRWTPPGNIHLTLKFLGSIGRGDADRISEVMAETVQDAAPIRLSARGLGVFPGVRRPRVLWIGLQGDTAALIALQGRLEAGLEGLGFARESRPFKAHLTIGRARGPVDPRKLVRLMERSGAGESPPFSADALVLYQSQLFPAGPVYTELKKVAMAGRGRSRADDGNLKK
jgi:2'-5' RNA ligase